MKNANKMRHGYLLEHKPAHLLFHFERMQKYVTLEGI